jgi:hypothetical protein
MQRQEGRALPGPLFCGGDIASDHSSHNPSPSRAGDNLVMVSKTTICSRCGLDKPLRDFYKQVGGAQGRRSRCKTCYKQLERESYVKDPKVQERWREFLERWRNEGLSDLARKECVRPDALDQPGEADPNLILGE